MNPRLAPLWALIELDGRLVRNALEEYQVAYLRKWLGHEAAGYV